ncbi:hypothetical protein [Paenibacillus oleatilyticus]|uniref:Uncharacterized protein n=1 Tax=Paenibacillus oleatilyticus TaxID=2594886 RepID=A0ABV4UVW7_9BACL
MKKRFIYGLLSVALTTSILASATTAPVEAVAAPPEVQQVQAQKTQMMWFSGDRITQWDGWVSTFSRGYFTVTSPGYYEFFVQQRTYDKSYDVQQVDYILYNENNSSGSHYFYLEGERQGYTSMVYLIPGTYHVKYQVYGDIPVRIFGQVDKL